MTIRVVIADDDPFTLKGLENFLHLEPDVEVLACCRTGEETLQAVRQHQPDLLILDIRMPNKDSLAVLQKVGQEKLPPRVVILTGELDENETLKLMRLGVRGIVLKEMAPQLMVQCIRKVHAGEQWPELRSVNRILNKLLQHEAGTHEFTRMLTPRELEIVDLVISGLHSKEIAKKLYIGGAFCWIKLSHVVKNFHIFKLRKGGPYDDANYCAGQSLGECHGQPTLPSSFCNIFSLLFAFFLGRRRTFRTRVGAA